MMLVALTVVVTVMQCHHHDAAGHAFFLLSGGDDVAVADGMHRADCHSHDCGEGEGEAESGCGMHLTDALTIDHGVRYVGGVDVLSYCPVDYFFDFRVSEAVDAKIEVAKRVGAETVGYSQKSRHRGPPSV